MPEFTRFADLDLPATLAVLAHQAESLPDPATMTGLATGELVVWLAVREYGPLPRTQLYPELCSSGSVTKAIRQLEGAARIDRYRVQPASQSDVVWDPTVSDPPDPTVLNLRAMQGEPMTDGGQVQACPACDRAGNVYRRNGAARGPDGRVDAMYYCTRCGADFDAPAEKPRPRRGGHTSGLARKLEDADLDEVLPDGGRPTGPPGSAADGPHPTAQVQDESLSKYSVRIPDELITQLDTLVEIGLYASRSEALRSAIRREVRLQAGDRDAVAESLQRTYDVALAGRRPETIGSLERLADQLGVGLEREVER
jgi:Arc/MetJ-type ribon-helix-helix transcriptional regulator